MSKEREEQQSRIDSSDDEREIAIVGTAPDRISYIQNLISTINPNYVASQHNQLSLKCALILHHYADRVFNRGDIRHTYQQQETALFGLTVDDHKKAIAEIRKLLTQSQQHEANPFIGDMDIASLDPQSVTQIFNYAFNDKVTKPPFLKESTTKNELLDTFKKVFQHSKDIDLRFLHKHQNFTINIPPDTPIMWPVAAELIRRSARDLSKAMQLYNCDRDQRTLINIGRVPGSNISCTAHKSGNIQVGILVGASTYKSEEPNLRQHAAEISELLKSGNIPKRLSHTEEATVSELASLMGIAEVVRSKAAVLTTPMFLDILHTTPVATSHEEYPMAAQGAVDRVRGIHREYQDLLPNARRLDEMLPSSSEHNIMLIQEGELLSKWAEQKNCTQLASLSAALILVEEVNKARSSVKGAEYKSLSSKLSKAYAANTVTFESIGITQEFIQNFKAPTEQMHNRYDIDGKAKESYDKLCAKSGAILQCYNPHKVSELLSTALPEAIEAIDEHILRGYYRINPQNIFLPNPSHQAASSATVQERYEAPISAPTSAVTTTQAASSPKAPPGIPIPEEVLEGMSHLKENKGDSRLSQGSPPPRISAEIRGGDKRKRSLSE